MSYKIGVLLPRSTEYPQLSFDLVDGLRLSLKDQGVDNAELVIDNIGFGADAKVNHATLEKMLLSHDVAVVMVYGGGDNIDTLRAIVKAAGKSLLVLDPGMHYASAEKDDDVYHISLQGLFACYLSGRLAGANDGRAIMATSFYDAGYKGGLSFCNGVENSGGAILGHYVSAYHPSQFNIDAYRNMVREGKATSVAANFSMYLSRMFMKALVEEPELATLPFYCSPYMVEDHLAGKAELPKAVFHVVKPWCSTLKNDVQDRFLNAVTTAKKKDANLFHLLGWEAGVVAKKIMEDGADALSGWSYEAPRGKMTFNEVNNHTHGPLYHVRYEGVQEGPATMSLVEVIEPDAQLFEQVMTADPTLMPSGWKNNFFCI